MEERTKTLVMITASLALLASPALAEDAMTTGTENDTWLASMNITKEALQCGA
jgi:hypothetical protein